ncbi:MAG: hypothetical protein AAGI25_14760 [Bacteroidota bacterium]
MKYQEIVAHSSHVNHVRFDESGHFIFSLGFNGEIKEWNTHSLHLSAEYIGHSKTVNDLLTDDVGQKLISISGDGYMKIWDSAFKKEEDSFLLDKKGLTSFFKVSEKFVWLSTSSQKLLCYDMKKSAITFKIKSKFKNQRILDYNHKKNILAIGGLGEIIQLINAENGELIKEIQGHHPAVSGLRFLDDTYYLSVGYNGDLLLVDFENEKEIDRKILIGENFYAMAMDTSESRIAISSAHKVSVLSSSSLEIIHEFKTTSKGNYGLVFSPSGKMLALASADKKVRLWTFEDQ